MIEKITGSSYQKFVTENIFAPLGMKDSGYDSNAAILPHRASGYSRGPAGLVNADHINMTVSLSVGGLYSTMQDLLKWEQGLFGGKLQPASLQKMIAPFKNNSAFGLQVETKRGHQMIDHNGGIEGFNTELEYYPDDQLTIAVLADVNGPVPDQIAAQLAAVAHGETVTLQNERKEVPADPKVLARYVGAYQLAPGMSFLITLEGNQLVSKLGPQPQVPIFPQSETMFFAEGGGCSDRIY